MTVGKVSTHFSFLRFLWHQRVWLLWLCAIHSASGTSLVYNSAPSVFMFSVGNTLVLSQSGRVSCRNKSEHNQSSNSADCRPHSKILYWKKEKKKRMSVVCRLQWVPLLYWWQFRGLQTSLSTVTLLVTVPWFADFTGYQYFTGASSVDCSLHWVPLLYWWQLYKLRISLSTIIFTDTVPWIADFTEYHYFTDAVPWIADFTEYH